MMKSVDCCKTISSSRAIHKGANVRLACHAQNTSSRKSAPFRRKHVAIIGAGAAGLICARECIREGLSVQIFEKSCRAGGTWFLDEVPSNLQTMNVYHDGYESMTSTVHSSMYNNLRTNLPRHIMSLSDYPFDVHFPGSEDPRCFPSRAEVLRYLDAFRKDYRLDQYISYETEVLNVAHDDDNDDVEENHWKIRIQSENEVRDFVFDAIAVCNGHYTVPNLPKITNISNFGKPCFHSHLYRNPESFRNKNILILGNGPSGNDISLEIAEVANKVYFCGRKWGSDIDLSKPMGSKGNVYLHTNINNCPARGSIQLEDGTVLTDVDEIMLCTGYVYNFPFLKNINGVEADGSYVFPVYKHVIDIHKPSLAYIGLPWRIIPFPLCEFQSKYFAKILTGKCLLPDANEMINDILCRQNKLKELKLDDRYYHMLGMDQFSYLDELASLCGDTSKLSSWRYNSYLLTGVLKREHRLNYRDQPFNEQLLSEAQMEFDSLRDNSTVRVMPPVTN